MKSFYESLEFQKVKDIIVTLAKTEVGKEKINNLEIILEQNQLQNELDILKEMHSFLSRYNELPISNSSLLIDIIAHGEKTGILSVYDLEKVASDISTIKRVQTSFEKCKDEFPLLDKLISNFIDLSSLEDLIHSVISPSLTIYDDASVDLKRIRRNIASLESDLSAKIHNLAKSYSGYLTDNTVTLRNGHYVLPVKTMYKFKVEGIIHDTSDSGNTVFVEPANIVEINNKIASLRIEEQDEIARILRKLTVAILDKKLEVIKNNNTLGYLDFLNAKAKYALENDGVIGNISPDRTLKLVNARHPLISKDKIVANDFYLDTNKHLLIISGPNAGGKSVALKTVGLLVVMHQCALPVLANEGALIPLFKRIYVDIGDQQSLNDSLSTFSAHMENIIDMSKKLGAKDLVIIDELGTGTDPSEGEALAKAILDYLHFKHAFAFVSSHFMGVKTYALDKEYVMNASMIFDEVNFMPTYKMRIGIPGKSYGMEVALRLGLDQTIIDKAKKYLKEDNASEFSTSLTKLDALVHENEKINESIRKQKEQVEKRNAELEKQNAELMKRKANLLKEVEDEKEEMLEETQKQIDEIMHELNKKDLKMHEVISAKKHIDDLGEKEAKVKKNNETFFLNDYVTIDDMSLSGTVIRIVNDKYTIQTNLGNIVVGKNDLSKSIRPTNKKVREVSNIDRNIISRTVPLELNLIGKHVDEAINDLERYLDDVVIKGYSEVRIIHGSGTGALRKAVHEYLSKQKFIKSFRLGGMGEGGVGATVVTLK